MHWQHWVHRIKEEDTQTEHIKENNRKDELWFFVGSVLLILLDF
jgi:hypothetical protein